MPLPSQIPHLRNGLVAATILVGLAAALTLAGCVPEQSSQPGPATESEPSSEPAPSSEAPAPAAAETDPPSPTLALVGGRVLDGYGAAPIEDGVILVQDERIVAIGTADQIEVPEGTPILSTEEILSANHYRSHVISNVESIHS